jgi:hypothetical protein
MKNEKQTAIKEFRCYLEGLRPTSVDGDLPTRMIRSLEAILANPADMNKRVQDIATKHGLSLADVQNDFRIVLAEVFEFPAPSTYQGSLLLRQDDYEPLILG